MARCKKRGAGDTAESQNIFSVAADQLLVTLGVASTRERERDRATTVVVRAGKDTSVFHNDRPCRPHEQKKKKKNQPRGQRGNQVTVKNKVLES